MSSFGHSRRRTAGPGPRTDTRTLGIVGLICAIAGFFVLGIVLGPLAVLFGWMAMGRRWRGGGHPIPLVAVVLGAIDTVVAILLMTTALGTGVLV